MVSIVKIVLVLSVIHLSHSQMQKTETHIASRALAEIIDHLSVNQHMRFTVTSIGDQSAFKDIIDGLMHFSNSTVELKYFKELGNLSLNDVLDEDVPNILLYNLEIGVLGFPLPKMFSLTKLVTYRNKLTLFYNLREMDYTVFDGPDLEGFLNQIPHDFYFLVHDRGSMTLFNNQLFFNKTCDSLFHPIDFFNSSTMQWKNMRFFIKYKKFWYCPASYTVEFEYTTNLPEIDINFGRLTEYQDIIIILFGSKHKIAFDSTPFSLVQWEKYDKNSSLSEMA
jgi:hypothetical protein